MLSRFHFAVYRFTYVVRESLTMSRYKGDVFRGRFGYLLREITCVGDRQKRECEKQCDFPQECVYSQFFETPIPENSEVLTGGTFAPHPFVLEPPLTAQTEYEPGETFSCHLILIGWAIDLLPEFVYTFCELGKRRIGLEGKRGQCQLDVVECLPRLESKLSQLVYTSASQMVRGEPIILTLNDVVENTPEVGKTLELDFLMPTRIKVNGRLTSSLTFELIIRNLLRRTRQLAYFHCGEQPNIDFQRLFEQSRAVKEQSKLRWHYDQRMSYRTNTKTSMSGFVGRIRFKGDLRPFLPLIFLGEYIHIGHKTAFGFGKYHISTTDDNESFNKGRTKP